MCKRVMAQCGLCAALAVASVSPALAGKAQSPATPEYADGKPGMSMMSAQVRKDGVVTFAAGAMSAQYLPSFKRYMVKFNRPVTGCPSVVTPLYEQGVAVSHTHGAYEDTVEVTFLDVFAREHVARDFQILVFCPR